MTEIILAVITCVATVISTVIAIPSYCKDKKEPAARSTDYFLHNLLICGKIEVYYRSKPR